MGQNESNSTKDSSIQVKIGSRKSLSNHEGEDDKKHIKLQIDTSRIINQRYKYEIEAINHRSEETIRTLVYDIRKKYIFTDLIGKGHFSKVRKAYEINNPEKQYAIKSIRKKDLTKHDLKKLDQEVEIMSSLHHPYIVTFHESYQDDMYFHIVMELCSGQELIELIKKRGLLNEYEVIRIIFQIVSALSYCHNVNICHRDLKPENILYFSNKSYSEIKIIDFGLSKKLKNNRKMNTILGTPFYISPEVLLGNYDCKSDMWSIGVMTYLMLSGQAPFYGTNRKQIFNSILTKEVDYSIIKNKCSDNAVFFIQRCLEKNPQKRISSQEALNHNWFYILNKEIHAIDNKHINFLKSINNFIVPNHLKRLFLHYFLNSLNKKELKSIKKTFIAIDQSNKGYLTLDDFEKAFEKVESNMSSKEIKKLFEKADFESCGKINFSQFIIAVTDSKVLSNSCPIAAAFKHFDFDSSGFIEVDDLQKVVIISGHNLNNLSYLDEILSQDGNHSRIDINEFKIIFG